MTDNHLTRFVPQRIIRAGQDFDYCPLDGDIPLLQFINTFNKRHSAWPKEYLTSYNELLIWCYEIRLIDEETYETLELEGHCHHEEAEKVLRRAQGVRENFYLLVDHILHDEPVGQRILEELNDHSDMVKKHTGYTMTAYGLREVWINYQEELAFPLWMLIQKSLKFLSSGDVKYIRICRCGNLFLDTTKNRNRRYCNPLTCGVVRRSKAYLEKLSVS